jgi:hypothetical protein
MRKAAYLKGTGEKAAYAPFEAIEIERRRER